MEILTDIVFMGEGVQLKRYSDGKYTIEEVAEIFGISVESVIQYYKTGQITIKKFKSQVEKLHGMKYEDIVDTVEAQINRQILSIRDNIRHYNSKKNSAVIAKAYTRAKAYSDKYHQLIAKGNIGIYRFNIELESDSIKILQDVIKDSRKNNFNELAVYYSIRLAFNHLNKHKKLSIRTLEAVEELVNDGISTDTQFGYYYFYGIVLNRMGNHLEAYDYFQKACQYASTNDQITKAHLNIALTYKKQGSFEQALLWNNKTLEFAENKELRSSIFNNIANVYIKKQELDKARYYVDKAMEYFNVDFDVNLQVGIYDTYIEIDPVNGLNLLDEILDSLQGSHSYTDNLYVIDCIYKCFEQLKKNKEIERIINLSKRLLAFCEIKGERRMKTEVKGVVVDILIYLKTKGGPDYAKIFF